MILYRVGTHVLLAIMFAAVPVSACAGDANAASANQSIAAAKLAIAHAAALGDQWTATIAAYKAARTAEHNGDHATAETQAKRALMLANLSINQATEQKKLWHNEVAR